MTFILILLALGWGISAWQKPRLAILTFPALLPVYLLRAKLGPLPTTLLELLWLATVCGVTLKSGWHIWTQGWLNAKSWHLALALWCLATIVAIFVAPNHVAALGLWRAYILEPILYFILLLAFLNNEKDRNVVIKSLITVTTFIVAWSAIQFLTGHGIPHPWDTGFMTRRATGPFPFPNAAALFCAPIAALCFGLVLFWVSSSKSQATRYQLPATFLWLGFSSATLATLLAKSLSGSLAILGCVLFSLIIKRKTRWYAVAAALLGIVMILAVPTLRNTTFQTLSFHGWSGKVRLIMWQETWNMLKDRPILGAGLGAYPTMFKPYHTATYIEIFQYPHDILLNLWSETGLLGILAFAWLVFIWIKLSARPKFDATRFALCALPLIAILIHGIADVPYFKNDLAFMFWILAALASSLEMIDTKNPSAQS